MQEIKTDLDGKFGNDGSGAQRVIQIPTPIQCYFNAFKRYAQFSGRSARFEYWWAVLFNLIVGVILAVAGVILGLKIFDIIYRLATIIPFFALGVRRLHDTGRSGWMIIVPFYNLYLLAKKGDAQPNRFGLEPFPAQSQNVSPT